MAKLSKMRYDALLEKNKAATQAMELGEKSDELKEKSDELKEGISRIPTDLPEELQAQIDVACERAKSNLKVEAQVLQEKAYDAKVQADKALDEMRQNSADLQKKGEKLTGLREIPLVGEFIGEKGDELIDGSEQMGDIAKETTEYIDQLAEARNKLFGI